MVKRISFGVDAGHVMEKLLKHAGIVEIEGFVVEVQPEGEEAVRSLLRNAADGGWIVELRGGGDRDAVMLRQADRGGVQGRLVDDEGEVLGGSALWPWSSIVEVYVP